MSVAEPFRLPEGYKLEMEQEEQTLIMLRPDGTPVAAFEFSAFGPDPQRITRMAWADAEWVERSAAEQEPEADEGRVERIKRAARGLRELEARGVTLDDILNGERGRR